MTTSPIVFGTDGWRGRIAEDYTFGAVRRCALGFARYMAETEGSDCSLVVGYDRRFLSGQFAQAAAEVLAAAGFSVFLTDRPTPTPAISYAVLSQAAAGAVNITASHNPPADNGFKVRDCHGGAVDPEGLKHIESLIPEDDEGIPTLPLVQAQAQKRIVVFDASPAYIEQLQRLVDLEQLRQAELTIMVDSMWGNAAGWFPSLLQGGRIKLHEIHAAHNPLFPEMMRPEPIPPNIDVGLEAARQHHADVLLITDGDADRMGLGDEQGGFVDQLRVFALLAYYMLEVRGERGAIVKTLSTTSMLNKLGELYQVPVFETGVGFKFVAPKMLETNALIGGEESGGYAFRGHVPERDGILAGLYLLDMMVRLQCKPSQLLERLFQRVGPHFYDRIDSPLPAEGRAACEQRIMQARPERLGGLRVTGLSTVDGYKYSLEDGGWLLIRFSGTESLVRVYCETTQAERVDPILQDGLRLVGLR